MPVIERLIDKKLYYTKILEADGEIHMQNESAETHILDRFLRGLLHSKRNTFEDGH